jgi:hypothetical protein
MSRFRRLASGLSVALLSGCASVGNTFVGTPLDASGHAARSPRTESGLVISGEEVTQYASRYFGLVEITLENQSTQWVRISRLALDFGESAREGVALPQQEDVSAWYRATLQRNDIRDTNAAAALAGILLLGAGAAVVGHASDEPALKAAGSVAVLGAETALLARGYDESIQKAERAALYPGTHLLAVPFAVPPGLFSKRWLLINTRDGSTPCVQRVILDYDVEGRGRERVWLRFRHVANSSEWQRSACRLESGLQQAQYLPQ